MTILFTVMSSHWDDISGETWITQCNKEVYKTSDCKGLAVVAHNLNINYLFILLAVIATIGIVT